MNAPDRELTDPQPRANRPEAVSRTCRSVRGASPRRPRRPHGLVLQGGDTAAGGRHPHVRRRFRVPASCRSGRRVEPEGTTGRVCPPGLRRSFMAAATGGHQPRQGPPVRARPHHAPPTIGESRCHDVDSPCLHDDVNPAVDPAEGGDVQCDNGGCGPLACDLPTEAGVGPWPIARFLPIDAVVPRCAQRLYFEDASTGLSAVDATMHPAEALGRHRHILPHRARLWWPWLACEPWVDVLDRRLDEV